MFRTILKMKTKTLALLLLLNVSSLLVANLSHAQSKADVQAIKGMCGCYEVTFKFADTFGPDTTYKPHHAHLSKGVELALVAEERSGFISIQHLLIVNDTGIVKHWRQDWTYEPKSVYKYDQNYTWRFHKVAGTKGQWKQQVFQVDDSPRYEGIASWIHADGRHFWESSADSPLPRREFTTRKDYNVLRRRNRHELVATGWVHEQDNQKIMKQGGAESEVAQEKGLNLYRRLPDAKCGAALTWWKANAPLWSSVRKVWKQYYDRESDMTLAAMVEGKPLFMHMMALKPNASEAEIKAVIDRALTLSRAQSTNLK